MKRDTVLDQIENTREPWDFLVIGGGATGLGVAVDASARGYRTLLVEQHDFAKGTSSRSTKLVHGGVRYLKQGNVSLVLEALRERGLLCENAPHLVHHLEFIVPIYSWWEGPFYGIGMTIYDRLAGKLGLSPSRVLSREETLKQIPTLEPAGLQGGVSYYDGQFDDSRLAVNLAQTIFDLGGVAINYMPVVSLIKEDDLIAGAVIRDLETGSEYQVRARAVINATGVFSDGVRKMDEPAAETVIAASQGSHVVLPKSFLPGNSAIMVPRTADGRVLFAVPWHDHVVVGTTDLGVDNISLEPVPLNEEIRFILTNAAKYLSKSPSRSDVLSVYAGLRPLVKVGDAKSTAALSRDHTILISSAGLLTIAGGKWTTYRKMAEDAVDQAQTMAGLEERPCTTEHLQIHGWTRQAIPEPSLRVYGADAPAIREIAREEPALAEKLHPELPYIGAEVVWAVRAEMARTVEDVLARRTRALLLGARASIEAAPRVAELMARELRRDRDWQKQTVRNFRQLAQGYLLPAMSTDDPTGTTLLNRWQRGVPVYREPVVTPTLLFFAAVAALGFTLATVRFFSPLGRFSGMNDVYAWGIWKTFNVMTLTALGSGPLAVGIAAWVFNRQKLHVVMRTALVSGFIFYAIGLVALGFDVGRPWNFWNALLPWRWNGESAMLEISICMPLYAAVFLAFENLPLFLERLYYTGRGETRAALRRVAPFLRRIYPFMITGAYVVPLMHQSSLGGLLLLAGNKINPLWQTPFLPLLYLLAAGVCGLGFVTYLLLIACLRFSRTLDLGVLGELGNLLSCACFVFLAVRFGDLVWRGQLKSAFAFDNMSLLFLFETALILIPAVALRSRAVRETPRTLLNMATLACLGGMFYRFVPTTIAYAPARNASYFPNLPELLMTVGYIALGIVAFDLAVKYFAVLPGKIEDWHHMFRLVRPLHLRAWRGASARRAAAGSEGEKPWPASL